jgi:hypothetical protein
MKPTEFICLLAPFSNFAFLRLNHQDVFTDVSKIFFVPFEWGDIIYKGCRAFKQFLLTSVSGMGDKELAEFRISNHYSHLRSNGIFEKILAEGERGRHQVASGCYLLRDLRHPRLHSFIG